MSFFYLQRMQISFVVFWKCCIKFLWMKILTKWMQWTWVLCWLLISSAHEKFVLAFCFFYKGSNILNSYFFHFYQMSAEDLTTNASSLAHIVSFMIENANVLFHLPPEFVSDVRLHFKRDNEEDASSNASTPPVKTTITFVDRYQYQLFRICCLIYTLLILPNLWLGRWRPK